MSATTSACAHCATGYAGVHSDVCPDQRPRSSAAPTYDPRPHRACEQCALRRTQTIGTTDPMAIGGPQRDTGLPASVLRPIGGACPLCGNALPDGSFADAYARISIVTLVHGEEGNPSQRMLWVGPQAKRTAVAA